MPMQRRNFLRSSIFFGASAAMMLSNNRSAFVAKTLKATDDIPIEAQQDPVINFTAETFEPYVGGYFQARNSRGEIVALRLLKVESFNAGQNTVTFRSVETTSFSLLFSSEARLPQFTSIHTIEHGALGQFDLFLTPRTGADGELLYEAVFNHLR